MKKKKDHPRDVGQYQIVLNICTGSTRRIKDREQDRKSI